jgi:hypothetical protein
VPDVDWALTGSMSFALQGVPVDPSDVDVQTDEPGARAIQAAFPDRVVDPVEYVESERIRSYLGRLEVAAVDVEIIGALRKRREDGTWELPVDVTRHRRFVTWRDREVPVLSLSYEADAYERLGRTERAAPLREHTGDEDNGRTDSRSR